MFYKFAITRPDGFYHVILMQNKDDQTWTFINMTKHHICPCRFKTVDDALVDLNHYMDIGKIIRYSYSIEQ